jgi:hypothetical protein
MCATDIASYKQKHVPEERVGPCAMHCGGPAALLRCSRRAHATWQVPRLPKRQPLYMRAWEYTYTAGRGSWSGREGQLTPSAGAAGSRTLCIEAEIDRSPQCDCEWGAGREIPYLARQHPAKGRYRQNIRTRLSLETGNRRQC